MNNIELAKRAVASKHWRWLPGMKTQDGRRVVFIQEEQALLISSSQQLGWFGLGEADSEVLPDLTDSATRGCVLEIIREACGDHNLYCAYHKEWWHVVWPEGSKSFVDTDYGKTEVEALIIALEALP
jgi:hypothetical protein